MSGFELPIRFWAKVAKREPHQCWEWMAHRNKQGYGTIRFKGQMARAARFVLIAAGHDMDGKVVRHTCDNTACVNPSHLLPGTAKQNVFDCSSRGRRAPTHGEYNNARKLSAIQVKEIRAAFRSLPRTPRGRLHRGDAAALASKYGITPNALRYAASGTTWKLEIKNERV